MSVAQENKDNETKRQDKNNMDRFNITDSLNSLPLDGGGGVDGWTLTNN